MVYAHKGIKTAKIYVQKPDTIELNLALLAENEQFQASVNHASYYITV